MSNILCLTWPVPSQVTPGSIFSLDLKDLVQTSPLPFEFFVTFIGFRDRWGTSTPPPPHPVYWVGGGVRLLPSIEGRSRTTSSRARLIFKYCNYQRRPIFFWWFFLLWKFKVKVWPQVKSGQGHVMTEMGHIAYQSIRLAETNVLTTIPRLYLFFIKSYFQMTVGDLGWPQMTFRVVGNANLYPNCPQLSYTLWFHSNRLARK